MNSHIEINLVFILEESVCIERVKSQTKHPDVSEKNIKIKKTHLK